MPGYNEADEGSGDSGVIAANGPSRDSVKKLDQIIQVDSASTSIVIYALLTCPSLEFPSQSRYGHLTVKDAIAHYLDKRWDQESQQMGKALSPLNCTG
jgi:hypothetical protein